MSTKENVMKEIVAQKIRQGRVLNAMSLQELADLIGVSKQMISKYENGTSMPSSKTLIQLAKSLKVNLDYFFAPSSVELGDVNFRKRSSFSVKKVNALKEDIKIQLSNYLEIENILKIDNSFENPLKKKKVNSLEDIENVVKELRNDWEIGFDPIHNIIQLLEDKEINPEIAIIMKPIIIKKTEEVAVSPDKTLSTTLSELVPNRYNPTIINKIPIIIQTIVIKKDLLEDLSNNSFDFLIIGNSVSMLSRFSLVRRFSPSFEFFSLFSLIISLDCNFFNFNRILSKCIYILNI